MHEYNVITPESCDIYFTYLAAQNRFVNLCLELLIDISPDTMHKLNEGSEFPIKEGNIILIKKD